MFSPGAVFVFLLVVAEFLVASWASAAFGVLNTIFALVVLSAIGLWFVRSRAVELVGATVASAAAASPRSSHELSDEMADRALLLAAGLLLIVPGFITAAAALLLFLPPIRALIRPRLGRRVQAWVRPTQRFGRSIIDVDVVDADVSGVDATESQDRPSRPELR